LPAIWREAAVNPEHAVRLTRFSRQVLLPVPGKSQASQLLRLRQKQVSLRSRLLILAEGRRSAGVALHLAYDLLLSNSKT
jgi:hypothetical protein